VLNDADFILGKKTFELEKKLSDYVGVKECITCGSGTDALLIPLMAKKIGPKDVIFTTNFSFFATTEVISLLGATPVFVDIDKKTFNIDVEILEHKIQEIIKEGALIPKAIIAVDLFGCLADYSKLDYIAKKYNLFLIEDACQSFGASYKTKKSCSFGNVAATSFYPAKPLGCYGDGGAIFTNDSKMAEIYRSIRVHGQGIDKYDNIRLGLNSRLDTIQAAVLLNKLKIFDKELIKRNEIAKFYIEKLKNVLEIQNIPQEHKSSWAQFCLLAKNEKERDDIVNFLNSTKIPTAIFYKKIFSDLNLYKNRNKNNFNVSSNISKRIFSIPMHPYLNKQDLDFITTTILNYFKDD